jgi:putative oxidoreductase
MFKRFLRPINLPSSVDWGVLILRVGISLCMLTHGLPKLTKLLNGNFAFSDPIGIGEGPSLVMAVLTEVLCSLFLILGLASRAVLIPLIFTMAVALFIIHAADPFDVKEHPLLFLIPYITLYLTGPGKFSLDKKLF